MHASILQRPKCSPQGQAQGQAELPGSASVLICLASAGETWVRIPARVAYPGGYRVLELTAGLKVISIACTPDLRDWGTLLGPLGTLMSLWLAG
jgi:hypothetical protein